jgi:hypothetical protein
MNTEIKFYEIHHSDIEQFILNRENGISCKLITGIERRAFQYVNELIISKVHDEKSEIELAYFEESLVGIEIQAGIERGYYTGFVNRIINIKEINNKKSNVYGFHVIEKHETCAWLWDLIPNYNTQILSISF